MSKILGIDLGTNSIGMTLREDNFFKWYGVYVFRKGVGEGKSGEFSLAAERTKYRSSRRLYNARRYRKWETLKVLIENDFCPLSMKNLNKWKHYKKGVGRVFPVKDKAFQSWIKLDFNGDGKPDYSSPYQLRRELISQKVDISLAENRHKIGRALYHIAQRRGFKSSRKMGANEETSVYKGSNETGTIGRNDYENLIIENGSLGAAFAHLEDKGIRIRNRYTLRSDYKNEVEKILEFQDLSGDFKEDIIKAIFYQRPLRSQKGLVGKCTMEAGTITKNGRKITIGKPRCAISHPKFEEYRAWSFVNNIKYKEREGDNFKPLPLALKQELIDDKFLIKSPKTTFKVIRNYINKGNRKHWILNYSQRMDRISIATCPVSAYFKGIFGEDWKNIKIESTKTRKDKNEKTHKITYSIEDIWHIIFSFEDEEYFEEFVLTELNLNEEHLDQLKKLWSNIPVGYANLSLKAINNILPFLKQGLIYSEAVFLAKIPEIIGKQVFEDNREGIIEALEDLIQENQIEKTIISITNTLIAEYKALSFENKFGYKNIAYELDDLDERDILEVCARVFGKNTWESKSDKDKSLVFNGVKEKYQKFFTSSKPDYFKQPKLETQIHNFLKESFDVSERDVQKLYHPSMIEIYSHTENQQFLKSPETRAFKNPMAYKTLHKLRKVINELLEKEIIDKDTRIVVEVARELNNKNKRAAIEDYQRERERENIEFGNAIAELIKDPEFSGSADPNSKTDRDKLRLWSEQLPNREEVMKQISITKTDIKKYRLWKEQNCICFYTGRLIRITDLFNDNIIDFEHTIPRSKSFDNSLANLTVCYANYNRDIKKTKIPTELPNYEEEALGFHAIKPHLKIWKDKIKSLREQIDFWKFKSKTEIEKDKKDNAIRRRHKLQMELDYWRNKVDRFTRKDIPEGFKNSQLIDTQLISKYAYHYLKTVFDQVETIKGSLTSQFREVYGIKAKEEEKDRSKHYHHAVDAAVLTLIPPSAKRKDILRKKYKAEEKPGKQYHEKPFDTFHYGMIQQIEKEILINNMKDQDQTLTPTIKKVRKRGKIEYLRDENGRLRRDEKGNKIPKIMQGDSVRGQLHKETFYGKIKIAEKDENGNIKRDENQNIIYQRDKKGNEVFRMVVRKPIEDVKFDSDIIVDERLAEFLRNQIANGVKPQDLKDYQGKTIRRLRCVAKAGRGVMDPDNATKLKEQTYKSDKEYKNFYYVDSGDNYMFGLYETEDGQRRIESINILDATRFSENPNEDSKKEIFKTIEPIMIGRGKKKTEGLLKHIFMPGQKVLFFFESKEELKDLDYQDLSNRLYYVKVLSDAKAQRIQFQHHLEARSNEQLVKDFPRKEFGTKGKDGFSNLSKDFVAPRLLLTPKNFNLIIEDKDFTMDLDGNINFNF